MRKLKKAYVEITNRCNLNCAFCPKTKRPPRFMEPEEVRSIIRKTKEYIGFYYLHVMGEPLLHPRLGEILDICDREEVKVRVTTNGTLIAKRGERLLSSPCVNKVSLSLHSFEANDAPFSLSDYLASCVDFCRRASEETGVITSLRLWNMDSGEEKGDNALNDAIFTLLQEAFRPDFSIREAMRGERNVRLARNCYLQMAEKFDWPDLKKEEKPVSFCRGLRDQIAFLADGTAVPCCLDHEGDIPLGNILTQELADIYEGERARALFDQFSNRRAAEPLCRRCGFALRF